VAALCDVEAATLTRDGSPPITTNHHAYVSCPLPRRIGTGACVDCFPVPRGLPQTLGGSASALSFSRPAQASIALRPARLLNRPSCRRRASGTLGPLSRGSSGTSCPATPPVSYQLNRQLAGWNLPPQMTRAGGAHQSLQTSRPKVALGRRAAAVMSAMPPSSTDEYGNGRATSERARCESPRHWRKGSLVLGLHRPGPNPARTFFRRLRIRFVPRVTSRKGTCNDG
jgi:hypothetical protein